MPERVRKFGWVLVLAVVMLGTSCAPQRAGDGAVVNALADEFMAAYLERYPEMVTYFGIPEGRQDRLTDNSLEALAVWEAREDDWLRRLDSLEPVVQVGSPEWAVLGILRETLEGSVDMRKCRIELWQVSEVDGWQTVLTYIAEIQPLGTDDLRGQALARARALSIYLDMEIRNLREGLRLGYSAPRGNVGLVIEEVQALLEPSSPLRSPLERDPDARFQVAYRDVLENDVNPALQRYLAFLEDEYRQAAREGISIAANPDGSECYRASIRFHSTMKIAPKKIHELGLQQMERIQKEMGVISTRSFGNADVRDLLHRLTSDPEYAFSSREEILEYAHAAVARAEAALPEWFGLLPRAKMKIEPYPAFREKSGTGEYQSASEDGSRPGIFYIPVRDPQSRPRAGLESLAFHEGFPGHHFQGSIALELGEASHPICRYIWNSGYAEGWGLYTEQLSDEMGLYSSDLDRMGMLSDQAARAARLVIDTGLHEFGWSRQQAIDYLAENTAWAPQDVVAEVDRYIVQPGQATAYMLGMLEIQRLRGRAEEAFGPGFDIRQFHDRVLENGSVTLGMLEEKIEHWIENAS